MPILGTRAFTTTTTTTTANNNNSMGTPSFYEFKKQASFFLKEKIKTARLALTDVTPAQLLTEEGSHEWNPWAPDTRISSSSSMDSLTEEATNGNPWSPDTRTMGLISRAAFEVDDYWRIVDILHKRLSRFDRKNWRNSYNALILLEHLLTHGPESVAEEFQTDKDVIWEMESFQYIDERGFNWGLTVRNKSERVLRLLEKGPLLKEERDRARKLTRGIEGFGSFSHRSSLTEATSFRDSSLKTYGRSFSEYNDHGDNIIFSLDCSDDGHTNTGFEENRASTEELIPELHEWDCKRESMPLLDDQKDELKVGFAIEEDHPFINSECQSLSCS